MIRNNDSLTSILFYNRSISLRDSPLAGIAFGFICFLLFESGICESSVPEIPFVFLISLLMPMFFLFLVKSVFYDIRNPRRNDISFIVGISYNQRVSLCLKEIGNLCRFMVLFVISSWGIDLLLNLVFQREKLHIIIAGLPLLSVLEALSISYCFKYLVNHRIVRATRKDNAELKATGTISLFGSILTKFTWTLAGIFVSPLKGNLRIIAKRQLTDIFRYDSFNSIAFPFIALPFLCLVNFAFKESLKQITQLLYIIGAYSVVLVNFTGLCESSAFLKRLQAYRFSVKELFYSNCYLFLSLTILFPVTYIFCNLHNVGSTIDVIGILQFVNAYVYLIIVSGSWHTLSSVPNKKNLPQGLLYGYMIVILPSLFIPVFGLIFPSLFYMTILMFEKSLFSTIVFHRKFQ